LLLSGFFSFSASPAYATTIEKALNSTHLPDFAEEINRRTTAQLEEETPVSSGETGVSLIGIGVSLFHACIQGEKQVNRAKK
jgi:hypothetical protein